MPTRPQGSRRRPSRPVATRATPAELERADRPIAILCAVGALTIFVRVLHAWQIGSAPFLAIRIGDAQAYHEWALRIAGGDWVGSDVFYQSPLYPYFLSIVYTLLNDSPATVRLVQTLLGADSCVLLAWTGIQAFGRLGALAGVALAIYPPAIFLDSQLDKSVLVTLLWTALLAVLVGRSRNRYTVRYAVWAGALLGLLVLARENAIVLGLPVLGWLIWPSTRAQSRVAGAFVAGTMLVLLPIGVRNLAAGGEFHLTTAQFGPNLYIGNHAGASGTYEPLVAGHGSARDEREDATRLAEAARGHPLGPRAVSRYWASQALDYVRTQPASWLRLLGRKAALALSADEIADTESEDVYADSSSVLRALSPFSFGVILTLAAAGMVLTAHRWRHLWLLYAMALTYFAGLVAFYVVARYRFPLVPVLLLFAAGGIADVVQRFPRLPARTIAWTAVVAAVAAIGANLEHENRPAARAAHFSASAVALQRFATAQSTEQAIALYTRALDELPHAPAAEFGLATALTRAGRAEEAVPHFEAAVSVWPDHQEARYNYGVALVALGRSEAAVEQLANAVRLRPDDVDARMAIGRALIGLNRPAEAVEQYQQAIERQPRNVTAFAGLGIALTMSDRLQEALGVYQRALTIDPNDADLHNNLGWSLGTAGQVREAVWHFERALALNPGHAGARENLARARALIDRREP